MNILTNVDNFKSRISTIITVLFCAFLFLCNSGCDKQHAKKLEGNYNCIVQYHYWDMQRTNIDSTYFETLCVTRSGKFISVLNHEIHIDSLWGGQEYYEGYIHNYIKVRFKNETIFVESYSGGLGGGATWTFEGNKE